MEKNRKVSKDGSVHVTTETFNASSHLVGALISVLGLVILVVSASVQVDVWKIVTFSIYGLSLFCVFFASTLHHAINASQKIEDLMKLYDYLAIFPLIAGTFTPICLAYLKTPFAWSVFGVIWGVAAIGVAIKSIFPNIPKWTTNTFYITMGWIGGVLAVPFYEKAGMVGLILLALGGVFYSIGFVIFNIEKPNPVPGKFGFHEIWHLFVLLGAASHYMIMYFIILPA